MSFAKKMMAFTSDLISLSNQTKLPSGRHEKTPVTFFTGYTEDLCTSGEEVETKTGRKEKTQS